MKAFQSIKSEMLENALRMTEPSTATGAAPMQKYRTLQEGAPPPEMAASAFPRWMEAAFAYTTHAAAANAPIVLSSCLMNGKPAHVIGAVTKKNGRPHITPLFLACQPWMKFAADPSGDKILRADDFEMDMSEAAENPFESGDA